MDHDASHGSPHTRSLLVLWALGALVFAFLFAPSIRRHIGGLPSKHDDFGVYELAWDGMSRWSQAHPGACPTLEDLVAATHYDGVDSRGRPYVVRCVPGDPEHTFRLIARGPDGELGTSDDSVADHPALDLRSETRQER